jgi:MOSC domain-containing protein YiiM
MALQALHLISVNVALPRVIGEQNGAPLLSAIGKRPVVGATIDVGRVNLAGDAQANLDAHGGPDKAVYAYPSDHWPWWQKEHGFDCRAGGFGENLTIAGADELAVRIGDRFSWGDALLEITQPRVPCSKLLLHTGRADAGALMTTSGRCGWYFRVLETGRAPAMETRLMRVGESDAPTVRETFFAAFDRRIAEARRCEISAVPTLSEAWRKRLLAASS